MKIVQSRYSTCRCDFFWLLCTPIRTSFVSTLCWFQHFPTNLKLVNNEHLTSPLQRESCSPPAINVRRPGAIFCYFCIMARSKEVHRRMCPNSEPTSGLFTPSYTVFLMKSRSLLSISVGIEFRIECAGKVSTHWSSLFPSSSSSSWGVRIFHLYLLLE